MREPRSDHYPTSSRDLSGTPTSSACKQRREPAGGGRGLAATPLTSGALPPAPLPAGADAPPGHAHLRRHFRGSPGADLGPRPGAFWLVLSRLCFRPRPLWTERASCEAPWAVRGLPCPGKEPTVLSTAIRRAVVKAARTGLEREGDGGRQMREGRRGEGQDEER